MHNYILPNSESTEENHFSGGFVKACFCTAQLLRRKSHFLDTYLICVIICFLYKSKDHTDIGYSCSTSSKHLLRTY